MPEILPNLHPLLVHFPIALISVSALFHLAAIILRDKSYAAHCAVIAHASLWLGALATLPTVYFGWQAFNSVNHDEASHAAMLVHRSWALGTLGLVGVLAGWDVWRNKVNAIPAWWFAAAVIGAWGLVVTTAWHGGELVYRHGLGVMSLPEAEVGHVHTHDHGAMTDDDLDHAQHQHAH